MNIFEKIRELKFPFIALVAALSFSGLVAPANAAVPIISNIMTSTSSSTSTQISISVSRAGQCQALLRLASSSDASQAEVLAATGPGGLNLALASSPVAVDGAVASLLFSGLAPSTAYTAYIVCQDGASSDTSGRISVGFTQSSGGVSYSACSPAVTVTAIGYANGQTTLVPGQSYSRV